MKIDKSIEVIVKPIQPNLEQRQHIIIGSGEECILVYEPKADITEDFLFSG